MRKILFLTIMFFMVLGLIPNVLSDCTGTNPCCCADPITHQKKCYTIGFCCLEGMGNEYWGNSCYNFKVWIEPSSMMFTVGQQTPINLYIQNLAAYPDNFDINYKVLPPANPFLIQVDISGSTPVLNVNPLETKKVTSPRITVMEIHANGNVLFNVTSQGDKKIYRNATLIVLQSDLPISLPEFNNFGLITMFILVCLIYIVKIKK
jgi:hypothetical protein